jgi:hypothetical protein
MGQDGGNAGRHKPLQKVKGRTNNDLIAVSGGRIPEELHTVPRQALALRTARVTRFAISGILNPL